MKKTSKKAKAEMTPQVANNAVDQDRERAAAPKLLTKFAAVTMPILI